ELEFSAAVFAAYEDGANALITVRRNGFERNTVAVNYSTSDGSAVATQDYTATNGTLQFERGELTKVFQVPIRDDTLLEGDETFTVALSNAVGAAIGAQSRATVVIKDDDCVLEFDSAVYSVIEYGGFATLNVRRTGSTVKTV